MLTTNTTDRDESSFDRLEFSPGSVSADYHVENVGHRLAGRGQMPPPNQPLLVGMSTVYTTGAYEFPRHQHTLYEVIVVERGPYRCSLNGVELVLAGGQALIIKPGDVHQVHLSSNQRHHIVHFRYGEFSDGKHRLSLFATDCSPEGQIVELRQNPLIEALNRLRCELFQPDAYSARLQDVLMDEFFWRLVRALPPEAVSPHLRAIVETVSFNDRIQRFFQGHVADRLTVGDISRAIGMSKRSLSTACKRHLGGLSPADAFMRFKVERARCFLECNESPIKEISYGLGFKNQFHFSKVFKRTFGLSPQLWRRKHALEKIALERSCFISQ